MADLGDGVIIPLVFFLCIRKNVTWIFKNFFKSPPSPSLNKIQICYCSNINCDKIYALVDVFVCDENRFRRLLSNAPPESIQIKYPKYVANARVVEQLTRAVEQLTHAVEQIARAVEQLTWSPLSLWCNSVAARSRTPAGTGRSVPSATRRKRDLQAKIPVRCICRPPRDRKRHLCNAKKHTQSVLRSLVDILVVLRGGAVA